MKLKSAVCVVVALASSLPFASADVSSSSTLKLFPQVDGSFLVTACPSQFVEIAACEILGTRNYTTQEIKAGLNRSDLKLTGALAGDIGMLAAASAVGIVAAVPATSLSIGTSALALAEGASFTLTVAGIEGGFMHYVKPMNPTERIEQRDAFKDLTLADSSIVNVSYSDIGQIDQALRSLK